MHAIDHPLLDVYEESYDFQNWRGEPKSKYLIFSTPRSGSTLLAMSLWRSGIAGAPLEYLNRSTARKIWDRLPRNSLDDYWRKVQSVRTSPNGVFGAKIFQHNIRGLKTEGHNLDAIFDAPNMIFLKRKDKIAQAVSLARARQTSAWFQGNTERVKPDYNTRDIQNALDFIYKDEEEASLYRASATNIVDVEYNELSINPIEICEKITESFNFPTSGIFIQNLPSVEVQRDIISIEWCKRFRDETGQDGT